MTTDLILGTAGHIDHGKTALIRALTGEETDRLPEEKNRGITIELGFAELLLGDIRLGIVDVPGHERFVRNMLAGATGMDLAMLVVAADDSVKPQTREHLEILRLLDLPAGVVALTKCDLADEEWVGLVEEEVRETVADSFLAEAPIIRTSAFTGEGLDELREALAKGAAVAARSERVQRIQAPFRMAIDRTFTMAGHGTVVTGTVGSGSASIGDELVVQPQGISVRVRGLQNHDEAVDEIHRGLRAAVNLAGIHHDEVGRGRELCAPGYLQPSRLIAVQLQVLPNAPRGLKQRSRIRVHLGTLAVMASVSLLDREQIAPGDSAPAQLFLAEPAVATWNQPFVVRRESPVITVGGGRVLVPNAEKIRGATEAQLRMLSQLTDADSITRASAAVYFAGQDAFANADLARMAGVRNGDDVYAELLRRGMVQEIEISPTRSLRIHAGRFAELCDRLVTVLDKLHDQHPLRSELDRNLVLSRFAYLGKDVLVSAALAALERAGRVRLSGRGVALVGRGPQLSAGERQVLQWLIERFREAGYEPPTPDECRRDAPKNQQSVPPLIALAVADGHLCEIAADFYLHADIERQLRDQLRDMMAGGEGVTLSQIRDGLGTTRKYAVPICEYLDRVGFTRRDGDLRFLGNPSE